MIINIINKIPVLFFMLVCNLALAQDSLTVSEKIGDTIAVQKPENNFSYKRLIAPTSLISIGAMSFAIPKMKEFDAGVRKEVKDHNLHNSTLDNYTQFIPAVMVYGFNISGLKGKHNLRERTIILATSQLISTAIVIPSKYLIGEERPDKSNNMSFPSGHAAIAFSTAQFMYREYRDSNYWLSLSGYPFAIFTSVYRVINNKHWVTDVVAGAGIGILSTELAYWLFPKINMFLSANKNKKSVSMLAPLYQKNGHSNTFGINYQITF